jgi:cytochrome c-type biogenesis protein CcmH
VSTTFWMLAAGMIGAALALLLLPLLRGGGDPRARKLAALDAALAAGVLDAAEHARKRKELTAGASAPPAAAARGLAVALALLVPFLAIVLYRVVGDPRAFDPAAIAARDPAKAADAPDMEKAVAGLAERLEQNPDDVDGWLLLGRAYKQMGRLPEAKAAFDRVRERLPNDPDVMVEYAETLALTSPERAIAGESRSLLERAAKANPQHQRALWLLGISDAQAGDYAGAIANWERLLPLLPADSEVAKSVLEQIADARREAGLPAPAAPAPPTVVAQAPAAAPAPGTAPPSAPGASLTVKVDIAPALKARVSPGDVLFVFARLPQGPRMPLAIQRLTAASLPLTVTLDDSMGMLPSMKLSTAEQVVVGARVSKSGNAAPQSGDLEALSAPITVKTQTAPIELTISSAIP